MTPHFRDPGVAASFAVMMFAAALCGCSDPPDAYPPPPQRPFFDTTDEAPHVLNMADVDVESHFVQDISNALEGATWRWAGKRPTVRLQSESGKKLKFAMDFAIAGSTLEHTGPVTLSFFVDNRLVGRESYAAAGRYRIEKPVPEGWVRPGQEVTLAAEIDKVYAPEPGAPVLGFILVAIGLEPQ